MKKFSATVLLAIPSLVLAQTVSPGVAYNAKIVCVNDDDIVVIAVPFLSAL